jgi:anti-sigma factor RsiW
MTGSKLVRMSVAAAIVVAGVVLGSGTAGAVPEGSSSGVTVQIDTGSAVQYACTGTDVDPLTVAVSIDECYVRDGDTNEVLSSAIAPVVVPGHAAATGSVTLTGLRAGDTFYICWTVTSIYEFKSRQTRSGCEEWTA